MKPRKKRETFDPAFPGYVREIVLDRDKVGSFDAWPFSLPVVKSLESLKLHPKVTFLVGENGSGKSTIIEAVAQAMGMNVEGGSKNFYFSTRTHESPLGEYLKIVRGFEREKDSFFLRAESFYNVATEIENLRLSVAEYGDKSPHQQSHGESFLALLTHRFFGKGVYVLDEPEAALSATGAIALLATVVRAARAGAQFVIATHSPILLACPGARIFELDAAGIAPCAYDDLDAVRLTRGFLEAPERYLRAALDADDAAV